MPSTNYDWKKELKGELEQLEGVQNQDPELGKSCGPSDHFYNRYTNRLFGAPFQLMHSVDARLEDINPNVGNEYLRNFLLNAPILEIKAGIPTYTLPQGFLDKVESYEASKSEYTWLTAIKELYMRFLPGYQPELRMFTFKNRYIDYMSHVNYMCRAMAYLLNLQPIETKKEGSDNTPNDTGSNSSGIYPKGVHLRDKNSLTEYKDCRWEFYRMTNSDKSNDASSTNPNDNASSSGNFITEALENNSAIKAGKVWFMEKFKTIATLGAWMGILDKDNLSKAYERDLDYGVKFLVEPISVQETFTNNTANSFMYEKINGLYNSIGTEVSFLMDTNTFQNGGRASAVAEQITQLISETTQGAIKLVGEGLGEQYLGTLGAAAVRAASGAKMIYPKIYSDSQFTNRYDFRVHLNSPYGDVYNYYMNIIVPLMHLICLAAPRMITGNSIKSPYIVQACMPGMCTINMGIITNMTIEKNKSSSHVSVDGFPLDVDVSFTIEELYNELPISSAYSPISFLANESLNSYLSSMAGLRPSLDAKMKSVALGDQAFKDYSEDWNEYSKWWLTGQVS